MAVRAASDRSPDRFLAGRSRTVRFSRLEQAESLGSMSVEGYMVWFLFDVREVGDGLLVTVWLKERSEVTPGASRRVMGRCLS